MKSTPLTIILTGGGSGGHITPLLSLARELKNQRPDCRLVYIGHKGDNVDALKITHHDFDFLAFINAGKFRRYHHGYFAPKQDIKTLGLNIRDLGRLPGSVLVSVKILRRFRPQAVFSKGGFVALPVGLAARLLKVPIITHDSDLTAGLANKVIGRWAAWHATGMPAKYYPYPPRNTSYVGVPIDSRIKKVTPELQSRYKSGLSLPKDSLVLLVAGGGNGSKRLNDLVLSVARQLLAGSPNLHIIHITGRAHAAQVKAAYKQLLPEGELKRVSISGFSNDFHTLMAAADLVVTRAGATTLAELAAAGKATLVIPSPYLAGGHQLKNAQELATRDAAVVVDETVDPDGFEAVVGELLADNGRRSELASNLCATAKPDAAAELAAIIIKVAEAKT